MRNYNEKLRKLIGSRYVLLYWYNANTIKNNNNKRVLSDEMFFKIV